MWVFGQECAAELPFLSPVKIIFQKFFFFFKDIVADLAVRYTLCAHCTYEPATSPFGYMNKHVHT
jgi:hypothetical protein